MEKGHYTSFVKNFKNGKWYNINDSNIAVNDNILYAGMPYILFYKKKEYEPDPINPKVFEKIIAREIA